MFLLSLHLYGVSCCIQLELFSLPGGPSFLLRFLFFLSSVSFSPGKMRGLDLFLVVDCPVCFADPHVSPFFSFFSSSPFLCSEEDGLASHCFSFWRSCVLLIPMFRLVFRSLCLFCFLCFLIPFVGDFLPRAFLTF